MCASFWAAIYEKIYKVKVFEISSFILNWLAVGNGSFSNKFPKKKNTGFSVKNSSFRYFTTKNKNIYKKSEIIVRKKSVYFLWEKKLFVWNQFKIKNLKWCNRNGESSFQNVSFFLPSKLLFRIITNSGSVLRFFFYEN